MKKRAAGKKVKKAAGKSKGVRDLTARKSAKGGLTLATTSTNLQLQNTSNLGTPVKVLDPYQGISLEA